MECNKDEAVKAKKVAEKKYLEGDLEGSKKMILRAQTMYPALEGINHMISVLDVQIAADSKISQEKDWYGILQVDSKADASTIKKQYRKLALLLHPDKNKSVGAEDAFKLVNEAFKILSDANHRLVYDHKRSSQENPKKPPQKKAAEPKKKRKNSKENVQPKENSSKTNKANADSSKTNKANVDSSKTNKRSSQKDSAIPPGTFWAVCPGCLIRLLFNVKVMNQFVPCSHCQKKFLALDPSTFSCPPHDWQGVPPPKPSKPHDNEGFYDPQRREGFCEKRREAYDRKLQKNIDPQKLDGFCEKKSVDPKQGNAAFEKKNGALDQNQIKTANSNQGSAFCQKNVGAFDQNQGKNGTRNQNQAENSSPDQGLGFCEKNFGTNQAKNADLNQGNAFSQQKNGANYQKPAFDMHSSEKFGASIQQGAFMKNAYENGVGIPKQKNGGEFQENKVFFNGTQHQQQFFQHNNASELFSREQNGAQGPHFGSESEKQQNLNGKSTQFAPSFNGSNGSSTVVPPFMIPPFSVPSFMQSNTFGTCAQFPPVFSGFSGVASPEKNPFPNKVNGFSSVANSMRNACPLKPSPDNPNPCPLKPFCDSRVNVDECENKGGVPCSNNQNPCPQSPCDSKVDKKNEVLQSEKVSSVKCNVEYKKEEGNFAKKCGDIETPAPFVKCSSISSDKVNSVKSSAESKKQDGDVVMKCSDKANHAPLAKCSSSSKMSSDNSLDKKSKQVPTSTMPCEANSIDKENVAPKVRSTSSSQSKSSVSDINVGDSEKKLSQGNENNNRRSRLRLKRTLEDAKFDRSSFDRLFARTDAFKKAKPLA